jgi:hypothetical protein
VEQHQREQRHGHQQAVQGPGAAAEVKSAPDQYQKEGEMHLDVNARNPS